MLADRRAAGAHLDPLLHAGLAGDAALLENRGLVGPRRPHCRRRCSRRSRAEDDLHATAIGDNEPYDGALAGDTIDAVATARGLANALIEVRQDLIAEPAGAEAWADRLARLLKPILADPRVREPKDFGSRASGGGGADGRDRCGFRYFNELGAIPVPGQIPGRGESRA